MLRPANSMTGPSGSLAPSSSTFQISPPTRDQLKEVVQRRHVIAHNEGRVSRLYLERTGVTEYDIGELLPAPRVRRLGNRRMRNCRIADDRSSVAEARDGR